MKYEAEEGHERNINDMTQVDEHKLPGKNKDALTINDSAYHNSDEYEDEISYSDKSLRREKSQSQILTFVTHQLEPLVSIQPSLDLESLYEGDVASPKA